jgi:hypothetical protein
MHYFSCPSGPGAVPIKSVSEHVPPKLCFCNWWDLWVTTHSGASEAPNVDALFFMAERAWCGFHSKRAGTHYAKLLFLHPVGSTGDIVHFGASWRET